MRERKNREQRPDEHAKRPVTDCVGVGPIIKRCHGQGSHQWRLVSALLAAAGWRFSRTSTT